MRQNISHWLGNDPILFRAEDLWQSARMLIAEKMQRVQGDRRMKMEQRTALLNDISQSLVSTYNEQELMATLAEGLPQLGIPSCYVSLYENPVCSGWIVPQILAYKNGHRLELAEVEQHFPSWRVLPSGLLSENEFDNWWLNPYISKLIKSVSPSWK